MLRRISLCCSLHLLAIISLFCQSSVGADYSGPSWWNLAKLSSHESPFSLFNRLGVKQRNLVKHNLGSLEAVSRALQSAIRECQAQFKGHHWNCSVDLNQKRNAPLFGSIINKGCRETAFVYAIISGAIASEITQACSQGKLGSCYCDETFTGRGGQDWNWGGCSDNARFGYQFAKKFIDGVHQTTKNNLGRYAMDFHNSEAGRLHILKTDKKCICHGASGSCTLKTCWKSVPDLQTVGQRLMRRFRGATRIEPPDGDSIIIEIRNDGQRRFRKKRFDLNPAEPEVVPPRRKDLVYIEDSPNFCAPSNGELQNRWTRGRTCNVSSPYADNCRSLCCNGYYGETTEFNEPCRCEFHWCCEVKCQSCRRLLTKYFCR